MTTEAGVRNSCRTITEMVRKIDRSMGFIGNNAVACMEPKDGRPTEPHINERRWIMERMHRVKEAHRKLVKEIYDLTDCIYSAHDITLLDEEESEVEAERRKFDRPCKECGQAL